MRRLTTLLFVGAFIIAACNKQDANVSTVVTDEQNVAGRECASHELLEKQIAENPQRAAYLQELERKTESYPGRDATSRFNGTLYIGVIVHVVHTNPNIVSDAQIQSQIDVLNNDFNKENSELANSNVYLAGYPLASVADCDIRFYLAGTVRKQTNVASFGTNDAVKRSSSGGSDAVSATTRLNFWVCDLSGGLLGYAQFPGGAAATDGVVCDYQAFGTTSTGFSLYSTFNKGRTATHEIGHWLNLRHIWGDARCGTDLVSDTPAHDQSNGGCPSTTHRSKCTGRPLEQWMNYMDYTYDACMYMFTDGQKTRMDAAIDNSRGSWVSTTPN